MTISIPRNLESLSFAQLTALEHQVARAKSKRYDEAVQTAESKAHYVIKRIAAELGIKPADAPQIVMPGVTKTRPKTRPKSRKGRKLAVLFRDNDNPENTWTGRGRTPNWLVAAEKEGQKREAFRVQA